MYLALSRDHLANEKNEGNVTYYYAIDGAYDYENHYDLIELEFADLEVESVWIINFMQAENVLMLEL